MVQMVGKHAVKHTWNLQGATGSNDSECEYCALTHGAAHGFRLKAYMADLGFEMSLHIFSDSSAARVFASRRGLGRQRHVQTRYLWLQERVAATHLTVQKVRTTQNPADILTQAASRERHWNNTEHVRTQTCRSSQQPAGTQIGESGQKENSPIRTNSNSFLQRIGSRVREFSSSYNSRVLNLHNRSLMLLWDASFCKGARPQSKKV